MAAKEGSKGNGEVSPADSDDGVQARGASSADRAAAESGSGENASQAPIAFRPNFLDRDESGPATPAPRPAEGDAFFVSVTKKGGIEIHRFEGPSEAQTFVEQLLEEGVSQEEMTAFSGRRLALKVSHRPVVHLTSGRKE